jgi:protein-tyrosine-phosphatase
LINLLFVCTGNTCRSPLAETIARNLGIDAESAGAGVDGIEFEELDPLKDNAEATQKVATVLKEKNIPFQKNREPRFVGDMDVSRFTHIICMTGKNAARFNELHPQHDCSVIVLGVPDPFKQDISVYRKCRDSLKTQIQNFIKQQCLIPKLVIKP